MYEYKEIIFWLTTFDTVQKDVFNCFGLITQANLILQSTNL